MDKVTELLDFLGIPWAYDHFSEGEAVDPPFICYRSPGSDNFSADGTVYLSVDVVDIELYTDVKDPELERRVQDALTAAGIFYEKTEVWIESEKLYEVVYEFELADTSAGDNEEDE